MPTNKKPATTEGQDTVTETTTDKTAAASKPSKPATAGKAATTASKAADKKEVTDAPKGEAAGEKKAETQPEGEANSSANKKDETPTAPQKESAPKVGNGDKSDVKREQMEDVDIYAIRQPIDYNEATHSIKDVVKNKKKYRFDLAIQRNVVWKPEQKSLFIHSILEGYPIPVTLAKDSSDGYYWMVDGQQRFTTMIDFVEGNFSLDEETPLVFDQIDIGGKYFDQLPASFQEVIMDAKLKIFMVKNASDDQVAEIFFRWNNGSPLKPIELTRALLGSTMNVIQDLSSARFFNEMVALTPTAKNRFGDQEIIMQTAAVLVEPERELSTQAVRDFMLDTPAEVIDEKMNRVKELTAYLEEGFDQYEEKTRKKILKKLNVPVLYLMADRALAYNVSLDKKDVQAKAITAEQFGNWAKDFFVDNYKRGGEYARYGAAGAAKKDNVRGRVRVLSTSFAETFKI